MTTTKKASSTSKKSTASVRETSAFHRLQTLLHTMRCITQHEDALCELSQDVKQSGAFTPESSEELRRILYKMPSNDYLHDLDSVSELLSPPAPSKKATGRPIKKPALPAGKKRSDKKSSK